MYISLDKNNISSIIRYDDNSDIAIIIKQQDNTYVEISWQLLKELYNHLKYERKL